MNFPFRISTVEQEGLFRASKWLKHAFLLSQDELEDFFSMINPSFLLSSSALTTLSNWQVSFSELQDKYQELLGWMQQHPTLPPPPLRRFFSLMLSTSLDTFYAVNLGDKAAIKPSLPVIQIQMYHCFFSSMDRQLRPMVVSPESFAWGLQISYPQIYEDPRTHQYSKVLLDPKFPNSEPFKEMVSWLRKHTRLAPLQEKEVKVYAPFRIGKKSLSMKESHVGLQKMLSLGVKISGA